MKKALFLLMLVFASCTDDQGDLLKLGDLETQIEAHPDDQAALNRMTSFANSGSFVTRVNAICILGNLAESHPELSSKVAPWALNRLADKDYAVQAASIEALRQLPPSFSKPAIPQLQRALLQGNNNLGWSAAKALGHLGPDAKATVPDLIKALAVHDPPVNDGPPQLRDYAADALGDIGPSAVAAIPSLNDLLKDPEIRFRESVAAAISKISSEAGGHE